MNYLTSIVLVFTTALIVRGKHIKRIQKYLISTLQILTLVLLSAHYHLDQVSGNGIDESVIYFLKSETKGGDVEAFYPVIGSFFISLVTIIVVHLYLNHKNHTFKALLGRSKFFLALGLVILSLGFNPAIKDLNKLTSSYTSKSLQPKEYHEDFQIKLSEGKNNLVFLYLESLEATYLNEQTFPGLMPNLKDLSEKGLFFEDIRQVYGTGWTIAGMVASQCGIPLVTSGGENSMGGVDKFLPKATCLGDILDNEDYELQYLGGASLNFAGKGNFYRSHKFDQVDGLKELRSTLSDPSHKSRWGLYDDSLFEIARSRYQILQRQNKPFAMFMLTLDTHAPQGHIPKSCQGLVYQDGTNPILNAVYCTDFLLGKFIKDLKADPNYKNTLIVIASDHLAMPNTARSLLEKGNRTNLLLILGDEIKQKKINRAGSTLDIAPTLLSILSEERNDVKLGLGRNLLGSERTLVELKANINDYLRQYNSFFNEMWKFPSLEQGFTFLEDNNSIQLGERTLKIPALILINDDMKQIKKAIFPFFHKKKLQYHLSNLDSNEIFLWIDKCDSMHKDIHSFKNKYCLSAGNLRGHKNVIVNLKNKAVLSNKVLGNFIQQGIERS